MLLVAGIGVFHLPEGGTGKLGTLAAVLEPLLIDRAVVQGTDLCRHHVNSPESGAFDHMAPCAGLVEVFALIAFQSACR